MTNEIMTPSEVHKAAAPMVHVSPLLPQNFEQLVKYSQLAATTRMVPKDFQGKPNEIMIAVQMGSELGLPPFQALQNIAVINGRPSLWGDAVLALVMASPVCEDIVETLEGEGDQRIATCIAKRKGRSPITSSFSVSDAKTARLWNKLGPWQEYPNRMLQMRARSFALRDAFPDLLRGLILVEEAMDIPPDAKTSSSGRAVGQETAASVPLKGREPSSENERFSKAAEWAETTAVSIDACTSIDDLQALTSDNVYIHARRRLRDHFPSLDEQLQQHLSEAMKRFNEVESDEVRDDGLEEVPS